VITPDGGAALRNAAAEIVAATRLAQGLPPRISDPAVLARLAVLLQSHGVIDSRGTRRCSTRIGK